MSSSAQADTPTDNYQLVLQTIDVSGNIVSTSSRAVLCIDQTRFMPASSFLLQRYVDATTGKLYLIHRDTGELFTVNCYDDIDKFELGDDAERVPGLSSVRVVQVAAHPLAMHTLVLDGQGNIYGSGSNAHGQLLRDDCFEWNSNKPSWCRLQPELCTGGAKRARTFTFITTGPHHSAAISHSGEVFIWGGCDYKVKDTFRSQVICLDPMKGAFRGEVPVKLAFAPFGDFADVGPKPCHMFQLLFVLCDTGHVYMVDLYANYLQRHAQHKNLVSGRVKARFIDNLAPYTVIDISSGYHSFKLLVTTKSGDTLVIDSADNCFNIGIAANVKQLCPSIHDGLKAAEQRQRACFIATEPVQAAHVSRVHEAFLAVATNENVLVLNSRQWSAVNVEFAPVRAVTETQSWTIAAAGFCSSTGRLMLASIQRTTAGLLPSTKATCSLSGEMLRAAPEEAALGESFVEIRLRDAKTRESCSIWCHKSILCARSGALRRQLRTQGNAPEQNCPVIVVGGISLASQDLRVRALNATRSFIYSGDTQCLDFDFQFALTKQSEFELLDAIMRVSCALGLHELMKLCRDVLMNVFLADGRRPQYAIKALSLLYDTAPSSHTHSEDQVEIHRQFAGYALLELSANWGMMQFEDPSFFEHAKKIALRNGKNIQLLELLESKPYLAKEARAQVLALLEPPSEGFDSPCSTPDPDSENGSSLGGRQFKKKRRRMRLKQLRTTGNPGDEYLQQLRTTGNPGDEYLQVEDDLLDSEREQLLASCAEREEQELARLFDDRFENFSTDMMWLLEQQDQSLSDVCLIAAQDREQEGFFAHRAILSARCPFFSALFSSKMEESTTEKVFVENISRDQLWQICVYIYGGIAHVASTIDASNLCDLLSVADLLQLEQLKQCCEIWLCSSVDRDNLRELREFARNHSALLLEEFCTATELSLRHDENITTIRQFQQNLLDKFYSNFAPVAKIAPNTTNGASGSAAPSWGQKKNWSNLKEGTSFAFAGI